VSDLESRGITCYSILVVVWSDCGTGKKVTLVALLAEIWNLTSQTGSRIDIYEELRLLCELYKLTTLQPNG